MVTKLPTGDFVLLTTFRRDGTPVPTAMWFAIAGDTVLMSTPAGAAKLKRLRHTAAVHLQSCSRRGNPEPAAPVIDGRARIVTDAAERRMIEGHLSRRYGWQWRAALTVERIMSTVKRREVRPRVALVVEPAT